MENLLWRKKMVSFIKKTWKFFLGIGVALLGGMLLFRKDRSGEIIESSTESGTDAMNSILKSNKGRNKKDLVADNDHAEQIEKIRLFYEDKKSSIGESVRKKIEDALQDGNAKRATSQLSTVLGIKNLDIDSGS
jgi:uncharacterized membrane protein YgaE (UPF0421/DUF939 family)